MAGIDDIVELMRRNPKGVRFADACRVCEHYFGTSRQRGTSHRIYKTPWVGDPRVNIQDDKGKANGQPQLTPAFARYLAAVEKLLGGKTFK